MQIVIMLVVTSVIFLIADALMLRFVVQPIFQQHLGSQLIDGIRLAPAIVFYLMYMAGILWFAGIPALAEGTPIKALINGAVLGLIAYGTYELTSWSVMRDWHGAMVAVDWAWGTVLTGVSAWAGAIAALTWTQASGA